MKRRLSVTNFSLENNLPMFWLNVPVISGLNALMWTGTFSQNVGKLFSELKLVTDNLLFKEPLAPTIPIVIPRSAQSLYLLTSVTYTLVVPNMFPFSIPHKVLAPIAQPKFWENPNSISAEIHPHTPSNNTGLLPQVSDNQPHNGLLTKVPT